MTSGLYSDTDISTRRDVQCSVRMVSLVTGCVLFQVHAQDRCPGPSLFRRAVRDWWVRDFLHSVPPNPPTTGAYSRRCRIDTLVYPFANMGRAVCEARASRRRISGARRASVGQDERVRPYAPAPAPPDGPRAARRAVQPQAVGLTDRHARRGTRPGVPPARKGAASREPAAHTKSQGRYGALSFCVERRDASITLPRRCLRLIKYNWIVT